MWFISNSGRRIVSWGSKFLGLWLLVGVLWLTFTNNAQRPMNRRAVIKKLINSSTLPSHHHTYADGGKHQSVVNDAVATTICIKEKQKY